MDDDNLVKLVIQCKSTDVDVKVDALQKLQVEFESGVEINEPDNLINVLKTCLRTSNQHLTTATLACLPPLLPLLVSRPISTHNNPTAQHPTPSVSSSTSSTAPSSAVEASTLRQVIHAFLPTGGVIDRLGDSREKARDKARETLVVLGGLAFRSGGTGSVSGKSREGKGHETPLIAFERLLREGGLGSKVWRVREQSILTLVHIRRAHHLFPIRPYLPLLVVTLEDGDAHVRECSRTSVVELFTGPGVTDAARADLKNTMTKANVRKGIVEGILAKLIGGVGHSIPMVGESESGDTVGGGGKKDYVPPSIALQCRRPTAGSADTGQGGVSRSVSQSGMKGAASQGNAGDSSRPPSRTAEGFPDNAGSDIKAVYITSVRDMEHEFAAMLKPFDGKETEHNWAAREKAVLRVRGMLKGDVHLRYSDAFLACLKESFIQWSIKALASLRTTVSANTCSLYTELAQALGPALDPFCETLLTNLLKMAGFTKKLTSQQSQASVTAILTNCSALPRIILPLLWNTLQEKTVQARSFVVAHIKNYLEVHGTRSKHSIESSGGLEILEKSVKKSLADPNPTVRESARVCFWVFDSIWRERGLFVLEGLDNIARKQLEKACPDPEAAAAVIPPPSTPIKKKTSVAAAIAASRAKAKAIATAPPSLRHQATSTSHAVRATSPPMKTSALPGTKSRVSSPTSPPARGPTSPSSPRSRILSHPSSRSVSTGALPSSQSRSPPSSTRASSPPSPVEQPSSPRRLSSPLATGTAPRRGGSFRKALETALPVSPPGLSPIRASPPRHNGDRIPIAVPVASRPVPSHTNGDNDLLMASAIPIPEDSDSDGDHSINLLSFSAALQNYPPGPRSNSQAPSSPQSQSNATKRTINNASSNPLSPNSPPSGPPQPIVEDALRARAEQAESAAERLLELVEPEEDEMQHSTIPSSLLLGSGNATPIPKSKPGPVPTLRSHPAPPNTPMNRNATILRQAALFKNSPAHNGSSSSLLDVLRDRKHETGWWLKRMSLVEHGTPLRAVERNDRVQELRGYIDALEQGELSIRVLQKLALLCVENPVAETTSPPLSPGNPSSPSPFFTPSRSAPSLHDDMWTTDKNFERMFNGLIKYLEPSLEEEEIEYGLIVLWEILSNQAQHVEGRETDVFSVLLRIRYCNKSNVLEATNTIRDALTAKIEPVYGLTTMHASLRVFQAEVFPPTSSPEVKAATYSFGLTALGKFILQLPAEVLEEELPRLRGTLTTALNDKSSLVIRESAAASIIAAQLVLRDETHLFTLLDGLADEKKNLLTYLFDKHGVRGLGPRSGGLEKLEREMRRLDGRTSTPPRPVAST